MQISPGLARNGGRIAGLGWHYVAPPNLPRQPHEVLVERSPARGADPAEPRDRRTIPTAPMTSSTGCAPSSWACASDGLVKANEEFAAWLLGERSMPFGANGEHVTIRLIDFDDIEQNQFVVTQQFTVPRRARPRSAPIWCCSSTAFRWS